MELTFEVFDRLQFRLGELEDRVRILESGRPPAPKPTAPPATCEQYIAQAQQPKPAPQPKPAAIVPELDLFGTIPCGQSN